MKVCVFCSSSSQVSPFFLSESERVGEILAELGHTVVYGGANVGLMGALANGVLSQRGQLIGIVPNLSFMDGVTHSGLSQHLAVETLVERKQKMIEMSDAFLVLAGGVGTLDEAFEVMALKSSGTLSQPIVFYNFMGVWDALLDSLQLMFEQKLIRQPIGELIQVLDKPERLKEDLKHVLQFT